MLPATLLFSISNIVKILVIEDAIKFDIATVRMLTSVRGNFLLVLFQALCRFPKQ
jgi:hypothetical protein